MTDPELRVTRIGQDVRDVTRFQIDQPAPREDADGNPVDPPDDQVTTYRVNSLSELTSVVDSAGQLSTYGYDLAGRPTQVSTPDGGTVTTTYDLAGHPRTMVNPAMAAAGLQSSYGYDLQPAHPDRPPGHRRRRHLHLRAGQRRRSDDGRADRLPDRPDAADATTATTATAT